MPSRIEKKNQIFDKLATNLTAFRPEFQEQVLCPFCTRTFERSALTRKDDGLTLEHIIPGSLGGKLETLSCKRCNNSQGTELEAHFVHMIDAQNWQDGDGSALRGKVRIGNVELPMKIAWDVVANPSVITILGAKPATLHEFQARARSLRDGDDLQLTVSFNYIPSKAQQALLRIAYLALFETLGYQYVLSGAGTLVRRLIDGDDAHELGQFMLQVGNMEENGIDNPIIISPIDNVAYLLLIRIEAAKRKCHYALLMPSSSIPEDSIFTVLSEVRKKLQGNQFAIQVHD